jgi:hypothetical protein
VFPVKVYRAGNAAGPQGHRKAGGPSGPNRLHCCPIFPILTSKDNKNPGAIFSLGVQLLLGWEIIASAW